MLNWDIKTEWNPFKSKSMIYVYYGRQILTYPSISDRYFFLGLWTTIKIIPNFFHYSLWHCIYLYHLPYNLFIKFEKVPLITFVHNSKIKNFKKQGWYVCSTLTGHFYLKNSRPIFWFYFIHRNYKCVWL